MRDRRTVMLVPSTSLSAMLGSVAVELEVVLEGPAQRLAPAHPAEEQLVGPERADHFDHALILNRVHELPLRLTLF